MVPGVVLFDKSLAFLPHLGQFPHIIKQACPNELAVEKVDLLDFKAALSADLALDLILNDIDCSDACLVNGEFFECCALGVRTETL